jgi:hypothetical protein
MWLMANSRWLSMMVRRPAKWRDHVLELHRVGARRRPFEADDVRDRAEPLDQAERDAGAGPEGVVDDDADVGGGRAPATYS